MKNPKSIRALFAFPGFNASSKLVGKFGDRYARVILDWLANNPRLCHRNWWVSLVIGMPV